MAFNSKYLLCVNLFVTTVVIRINLYLRVEVETFANFVVSFCVVSIKFDGKLPSAVGTGEGNILEIVTFSEGVSVVVLTILVSFCSIINALVASFFTLPAVVTNFSVLLVSPVSASYLSAINVVFSTVELVVRSVNQFSAIFCIFFNPQRPLNSSEANGSTRNLLKCDGSVAAGLEDSTIESSIV